MSPTTAYVVPAATIVFLALISAPTSAVGTPDAGPDAAAEALPPARDLTIVQKIRADPDLSSCTTYPLRSMIADKSINEEFLQCSDVAVPDGDSVLFSDGEKDAVVPFCLANFFSFEVLCKAPPASVASANKGSAPLFKDTNLEFKPSLEFCNKLGSTLVQFDCEAVKQKVPGASVARCNAFNEARTTLLNNCPTVSRRWINTPFFRYIFIFLEWQKIMYNAIVSIQSEGMRHWWNQWLRGTVQTPLPNFSIS